MEKMEESNSKKAMVLTDLPIECWEKFLPASKSLLMSRTSKNVGSLMARGRPQVEVHVSLQMRFDFSVEADVRRRLVLQKLGAMAAKYHIVVLDLIYFGMTDQDFPQLAVTLESSVALKCLQLAGNHIGLGVRALTGMANLTSLTTLNLARCNNQLVWALSLAEILRRFPSLVQLSLEGNRLGRTSRPVETPPPCPALKLLRLQENFLKVDGLLCVKEVLKQCPQLEYLDLSSNAFESEEMDVLVGMFEHCPRISYLNFDANDMQHETNVELALAQALSPLEMMTEVNLQFNTLGGLRHVGPVLQKCKGLQYLNLGFTSLGNDGARILAGVMGHFEELKALNVSANEISFGGAQALAAAIGRCKSLLGLNMSSNAIGSRGAVALASVIGNCQLKFLYLSHCGIGASGCEALATVPLEHLDDLQVIDNDIEVRGMTSIARAAGNWALTSLSCGSNYIGPGGMKAVADVMTKCKLTYLDLARNNVQDEGLEILKAGLRECHSLKELCLNANNITDVGASSLAEVLSSCSALTQLNLSYNDKIGADGERALSLHVRNTETHAPLTIELQQRGWLKAVGGTA